MMSLEQSFDSIDDSLDDQLININLPSKNLMTSVGHGVPSERKRALKQPVKVHIRPVNEKMRVEAWGSEARQD